MMSRNTSEGRKEKKGKKRKQGELFVPGAGVDERKKRIKRRWCLLFTAALVLSLLSYSNSFTNQFVFDDFHLISENPTVKGFNNLPRLVGIGKNASYRPVRMVSYALDYTLNQILWSSWGNYTGEDNGLNPVGYHVSNCAYHLITSILVFLIVFKLVADYRASFLAATLFILHPVHTDSVTYLAGRRDILCALFYLAGFYFFLRFRETSKIKWLVVTFVAYILGLGSKEMAVTLPAVLLCYDVVSNFPRGKARINLTYCTQAGTTLTRVLIHYRYFYTLIFSGALSFSYYKVFIKSPSHQSEYYGGSMLTTLCTAGKVLVYYMKLLIYPIVLNADYSYNAFPLSPSLFEPAAFLSFVVLGIMGYAVLRLIGNYKMLSFGLIWFFVTMLPVSQIIPHHELLAEHYLYLPSFGFCLAVAVLINEFLMEGRCIRLMYAVLVGVAILFTVRIADRNRDWKDGFTLWGKTVNTVPQCARAHNNLGSEYDARGWFDKAALEYKKAIAIKPVYAEPYNNLGLNYYKRGEVDKAIAMYKKALDLKPRHVAALVNLGGAYVAQGKADDALNAFRKAIKIRPRLVEAYIGLGVCFAKKGNTRENKNFLDLAIYCFKKALELKPHLPEVHNNLASTYYLKGDYTSALYHCNKVRELGYDVSPQLSEALKSFR